MWHIYLFASLTVLVYQNASACSPTRHSLSMWYICLSAYLTALYTRHICLSTYLTVPVPHTNLSVRLLTVPVHVTHLPVHLPDSPCPCDTSACPPTWQSLSTRHICLSAGTTVVRLPSKQSLNRRVWPLRPRHRTARPWLPRVGAGEWGPGRGGTSPGNSAAEEDGGGRLGSGRLS
jgi:hypothetical protein